MFASIVYKLGNLLQKILTFFNKAKLMNLIKMLTFAYTFLTKVKGYACYYTHTTYN